MMTCFPQVYCFVFVGCSFHHQSAYTPLESFPLDPPPPYSIYSSIAQSESNDSHVFPPDPWDYIYDADTDWD